MTENTNRTPARKVMRGRPYSIAEFARKYRLDETEAKRIFYKFGPSSTELDLLMAAKRKQSTLSSIIGH
ncbi:MULTISPECIES: hypothetical protein [unclassified Rhizobium]|uniref:hypothetical protein n=1 Tax=unclassified Rhizobium TaxID=2613769 RepID=UPI000827C89F|nr:MULTISPECIES: hypothetical protein [unclassified Rhizobium]OCJ12780.1 hypothetical protein A6U86_04595 [Rhizobium sp. AC27/96]TIX89210.1 hypothetical protein BSK43_021655 [Rhizobium sp. P44RR-XXIV]